MKSVYNSIMAGLTEAVEDAKGNKKQLTRRVVTILPVKQYTSEQIKEIRNKTKLSQRAFAGYLGVSPKTVEAWEAGTNHPNGSASRLLNNQKKMKASTIQSALLLVSSHSDLLDTSELWIIIRILNIKMKIIFNFEQRKHDHEHSHTLQKQA